MKERDSEDKDKTAGFFPPKSFFDQIFLSQPFSWNLFRPTFEVNLFSQLVYFSPACTRIFRL